MSHASVRAAAEQAAKQGHLTPHQLAALTALDSSLTEAQKSGFTELWRAQGSPAASASKQDVENTWAGFTAGAKDAGAVFPELVAAQWALESGWGKHLSGKFNYFGLKGQPGTKVKTKEVVNGREVTITAEFKDFNSRRECIAYLVDRWYKDFENYKGVNRCASREEAAVALKEQGYATDPQYPAKLIKLMDAHSLKTKPSTESLGNPRQPAIIRPGSPFSIRLSPHFTLGEFALQQESRRFQHQHQVDTAAELAAFLERLRAKFGKPVTITSGYRPPSINKAIGGAVNSEHLYLVAREGAVDVSLDGANIYDVQDWISATWPYSVGYGARLGFVHVGRRAGGQRLRWDY